MSTDLHRKLHTFGTTVIGPVAVAAFGPRGRWLRHVPTLPRNDVPTGWWPDPSPDTPEALRTVPGIWRDPEAEQEAYEAQRVVNPIHVHPRATEFVLRNGWKFVIPSAPRTHRAFARIAQARAVQPSAHVAPPATDPARLTDAVREEAKRLGLSRIGFAAYDPKYAFPEADPLGYDEGSVIVAVLEQGWTPTQNIPSSRSERHAMRVYNELVQRTSALAEFIHTKGFRAQPHSFAGEMLVIHYGVEAGLGQLGLNGQLLTPQAGSRCRIALITTNATFVHDTPKDYGVHALCDECQLCVRRCPPGAIPLKRAPFRGVTKAKIKLERCLPTMAQSHGCAVCMKVCPVQRYGLDRVKEHWVRTGEILGKGTDELEGFDWIDGRHYGPGEKPRITSEFLQNGDLFETPEKVEELAAEGAASGGRLFP